MSSSPASRARRGGYGTVVSMTCSDCGAAATETSPSGRPLCRTCSMTLLGADAGMIGGGEGQAMVDGLIAPSVDLGARGPAGRRSLLRHRGLITVALLVVLSAVYLAVVAAWWPRHVGGCRWAQDLGVLGIVVVVLVGAALLGRRRGRRGGQRDGS